MRVTAAARRYARALFSIARDEGRVEETRRELDAISDELASNTELEHAVLRPLHPAAERRGVLQALCDRLGTSPSLRNFCAFLIDQRRAMDLDAIRTSYHQLADEAAGRTKAQVVSASPLQVEQRERLRRALAARTGGEVELEESVDPELLGGAIARVGDLVFDGSLRRQLDQLRTTLTRGQ